MVDKKKLARILKDKNLANIKVKVKNPYAKEYLDRMYNNNDIPKRRRFEPDEMADLFCAGEMIFIKEDEIPNYPKHRVYRFSPRDIFAYTPKRVETASQTLWPPDEDEFDPE